MRRIYALAITFARRMRDEQSEGNTRPPWEDQEDAITKFFRAAVDVEDSYSSGQRLFVRLCFANWSLTKEEHRRRLEVKFQNLYARDPWMIARKQARKLRAWHESGWRFSREMTEWASKPSLESPRREMMISKLMRSAYFRPEPRGPPPWVGMQIGEGSPISPVPSLGAAAERLRNPFTRLRVWSNHRISDHWEHPRAYNLNTRLCKWRVDRVRARIEAANRIRHLLRNPQLVPERLRPSFMRDRA